MMPRIWPSSSVIRRRHSFLVFAAVVFCLYGLYRTAHSSFKTSVLQILSDPLWAYPYVNASAVAYPPHDPTYLVFSPPKFEFHPVDESLSEGRRLPHHCLDAYFTTGVSCHAGPDPPLDVVWTWTNGSDRLVQEDMSYTVRTTNPKMPTTSRPNSQLFRNHDELRHSIRSVLKHFVGSTTQLHIVTSDFKLPLPVMDGNVTVHEPHRLGLVPRWLDPERVMEWQDGNVRLGMKYHSEIFRAYNGSSFNSYGIETQLANLKGISDNFIYMNDDFFMLTNLTASDFYTSAYGVVLRLQVDLLVKSNNNPHGSVAGEWGPLEYTNWCLSNRFGSRRRPYMAHAAKSISLSLMQEFSRMWEAQLAVTAAHPFRGMTVGHKDVYSLFLFSHSIVERWREGLLWAWAVAKIGGMDDVWGPAERDRAWRDVGGVLGEREVNVPKTARTTAREDVVRDHLHAAGHTLSGSTKYVFVSADGYPYDYRDRRGNGRWPSFTSESGSDPFSDGDTMCTIDYKQCFDFPGINKASDFFTRIAFDMPVCGDYVINALRAASGPSGLAAFLPDVTRTLVREDSGRKLRIKDVPHLPLVSDWKLGNFSLQNVIQSDGAVNIREWTLRMLERYSCTAQAGKVEQE
ncbi:hypothetical protein K439DRAFT_670883 [Ramaria rubella]|nr:hypothetical protein K439DRAFT_670883 [Ramaria rubella]